jgi:hypothetical protein
MAIPKSEERATIAAHGSAVSDDGSMDVDSGASFDSGVADDSERDAPRTTAVRSAAAAPEQSRPWDILSSIAASSRGLGAFQATYGGPGSQAQAATRFKGRLVSKDKEIFVGRRNALFYFSATGKRVYLKQGQLRQCEAGRLPGDRSQTVCGHIDTSDARPTARRSRYGNIKRI